MNISYSLNRKNSSPFWAKSDPRIDDESLYLNYLSYGEQGNAEYSELREHLLPQEASYFAYRFERL